MDKKTNNSMVHKILHRKRTFEQHELNIGVNSGALEKIKQFLLY